MIKLNIPVKIAPKLVNNGTFKKSETPLTNKNIPTVVIKLEIRPNINMCLALLKP